MIEVSELISELVGSIDRSIVGDSITGPKVHFCNTKWARKGKTMINGFGQVYNILDVESDDYIIAQPVDPLGSFSVDTYYLTQPFFITGTKWATNREWTRADNNLLNKTPIIWLLETIQERVYGRGSSVERDIDIRLFFLDETNVAQFYTEDHRREVVKPMQELALAFIDAVRRNANYRDLDEYTLKTFSRFGVENDQGVFQNVLDANLSGVELRLTLSKYKDNCKCSKEILNQS